MWCDKLTRWSKKVEDDRPVEPDPGMVGTSPGWFRALGMRGRFALFHGKDDDGQSMGWLEHVKLQILMELELLKVNWWVVVLLIFVLWAHSSFSHFVYYLYVREKVFNQQALYDIGFEYFPGPDMHVSEILRKVFFFAIIGTFALVVVQPFFVVYQPSSSPDTRFCTVHLLRRYVITYSLAATLRVAAFMVTVLPASGPWCHAPPDGYFDPKTPVPGVKDVLLNFDTEDGCGDMLFSGHTLFMMLCCLTFWRYSNWNVLRCFEWMIFPFYCWFCVKAYRHYTVDVVMAVYIVPLVYHAVKPWGILSEQRDARRLRAVIARHRKSRDVATESTSPSELSKEGAEAGV